VSLSLLTNSLIYSSPGSKASAKPLLKPKNPSFLVTWSKLLLNFAALIKKSLHVENLSCTKYGLPLSLTIEATPHLYSTFFGDRLYCRQVRACFTFFLDFFNKIITSFLLFIPIFLKIIII
jgi:hypothetical protein